jgi:hypothetical protein
MRYARVGRPSRTSTYADRETIESRFRLARFARLMPIIDGIIAERGACRIIDLGGTQYYWALISEQLSSRNISILMVNLEPTGAVAESVFKSRHGDVTDLSDLADNSFDMVHSNSVIEHVGSWANMKKFAYNARRLAPYHYIQTPSFWFPLEPHFRSIGFHWLPEQVRYRRVMAQPLGFFDRAETVDAAMREVQGCALLDARQLQALFPDSRLERERFLGLTKSLMAIRAPQVKPN